LTCSFKSWKEDNRHQVGHATWKFKKRPIQRKIDGLWPKQNSPSGTISCYKLGKGKQKKKWKVQYSHKRVQYLTPRIADAGKVHS